MNEHQKIWVSKTMKMTSYLLSKGFEITAILPDKYNPSFNVWLFEIKDGFYDALEEYKQRKQPEKVRKFVIEMEEPLKDNEKIQAFRVDMSTGEAVELQCSLKPAY